MTLKYGEPRCSRSRSTKRCSSSSKRARNSSRCSSCRRKSTAEIPLCLPAERLQAFFELSLEALSGLNRLGYRTPRRFIVIPPYFPRHTASSAHYSLCLRDARPCFLSHKTRVSMASREVRVRGRPSEERGRGSEPATRAAERGAAENPQLTRC